MAQLNVLNAMKDAILKESQSKLTEEQAKAIVAQIAQGWEGLDIQKRGQTLQKTIAEWTNEREYTIGRERIDNQRMSIKTNRKTSKSYSRTNRSRMGRSRHSKGRSNTAKNNS